MSYKKILVCIACMTFNMSTHLLAQGIIIQSGGQLVANGAINLVIKDGNFTNNGTFTPDNSTVSFTGDSTYATLINGTSITDFQNMLIGRTAGDVQLQQAINISGTITMNNHNLLLGNYVADLGTTGSVVNESDASKIISSVGTLNRTIDLNAPVAINPGNIGIEITSAANLGTTLIKRYNTSLAVTPDDNSIIRYYDVTPTTNNTLNATITIHYFDSELGALNKSDLNVWSSVNSGTTWSLYGKTASDAMANTVTTNRMDTLARLTLASNVNNLTPLAVKLLSFVAKHDGQQVVLNWVTAQEVNNDHFTIERSVDGVSFAAIGTVLSKGNSNTPQTYIFADNYPVLNTNYYRLRMVDKDNKYEYSATVSVNLNAAGVNKVTVFPVPVVSNATVKITSVGAVNCKFILLDGRGNTVSTGSWNLEKGVNVIQLPMAQLAGGVYYLHLTGIAINPIKLHKE